jgi:DNA modification methylase
MKQNDVWEFDRPTKSDLHPTMKPVDLVGRAIKNSSNEGDLILDIFGGAGSTMVASHKNKRVNSTMELDPIFVDVIVRRMQEFTGDKAVLEGTGELFDDLLN